MALQQTPESFDRTWQAPDFQNLKATDGKSYALSDIQKPNGFLVMFICNHCPYVKGIVDRLPDIMKELQKMGVGVIAINSNDAETYPEDGFEPMKSFAKYNSFTFPYAIDETQNVAKAYGAICTPDFFGFNGQGKLQYRGRLDSSGMNPATSETMNELLEAFKEIVLYGEGPAKQTPSMGCSIKWKT
ncbi:MAG: peroxiredoxin [Alphaproteobacteria bacterium]|jgi:peroxiredoxin